MEQENTVASTGAQTSSTTAAGQSAQQGTVSVDTQTTATTSGAAPTGNTPPSDTHITTAQTPDPAMEGRKRAEQKRQEDERVRQENAAYKTFLNLYDEELRENPDLFDRINQKFEKAYGKPLGTYEELYGTRPSKQTSATKSTVSGVPDLYQFQQLAEQTVNKKFEQQEALSHFVREVPEMAMQQTDSEEIRQEKSDKFARVLGALQFDQNGNSSVVEHYKRVYGMNLGQIFAHFYRTDPLNLPKLQEASKQDGVIAGKQQTLRSGAGVVGAISGSSGGNAGIEVDANKLTAGQREQYQALLASDPAHAQKYYERAVNGGPIRKKN